MSLIKLNNNAVKNIDSVGSLSTGSMIFIKKLTASSSATLSFVDGTDGVVLDDTYKEYYFTFNNIHPATDGAFFGHQADVNGGSSYAQTCTNTFFYARHNENDATALIEYSGTEDQAQGTNINYMFYCGADNDQSGSGYLHIFNPSSSVFVKHFISSAGAGHPSDRVFHIHQAGYYNTTNVLDRFQFKFSSGNIDAGDICLYGIA